MSTLARFTFLDSWPPRPWLGMAPAGVLQRLARGRRRALLLRVGAMALATSLIAAGALGIASGLLASRPATGQAFAAPNPDRAAPRWAEIRRPLALYDLAGTEFSRLPASYRARRREPDGAREDVMTFGALGVGKPYLQVSLLRAGTGPAAVLSPTPEGDDDGLADGLARLAGTRGLTASRIRPAAPMDTRLGRFEAADLLLWDGGAATPCLGFRSTAEGAGGEGDASTLRVAGFACGAPTRPMGRAALACAIDRIDLVSAGDDAALRALFVSAERRGGIGGGTCVGGPSLAALEPGGRRLGWLDPDGELPPLRGLFEATARRH